VGMGGKRGCPHPHSTPPPARGGERFEGAAHDIPALVSPGGGGSRWGKAAPVFTPTPTLPHRGGGERWLTERSSGLMPPASVGHTRAGRSHGGSTGRSIEDAATAEESKDVSKVRYSVAKLPPRRPSQARASTSRARPPCATVRSGHDMRMVSVSKPFRAVWRGSRRQSCTARRRALG
jgi:hypothetical protein